MVRVPSVESLVGDTESGSLSRFDSELLGLEVTTMPGNGSPKLEVTTAMLGHSGMTEAEAEVVRNGMSIAELEVAIPATEKTLVNLQLLQAAYRQAHSKLVRVEEERQHNA